MSLNLDQLLARPGGAKFLPLAFRLAARLEQIDWREMTGDPASATFALRATQNLLGADGLINWFDGWLEAEAAGTEVARDEIGQVIAAPKPLGAIPDPDAVMAGGDVPAMLETARRLCAESSDQTLVLGYLTGGRTLLDRFLGAKAASKSAQPEFESAAQVSLALARAYCEAGVGALLVAEETGAKKMDYLRAFDSLLNLAHYFTVPVVFLCREKLDSAGRDAVRAAGFDHVVAPGDSDSDAQIVGVSNTLLTGGDKKLDAWAAARRGSGGLFLSEWEIDADTAPERIVALGESIKG